MLYDFVLAVVVAAAAPGELADAPAPLALDVLVVPGLFVVPVVLEPGADEDEVVVLATGPELVPDDSRAGVADPDVRFVSDVVDPYEAGSSR